MPDNPAPATSQHTRQGIVYVVLGVSAASFTGAVMKLLSADLSPFQIAFFRFLGLTLLLTPFVVVRFGRSILRPARVYTQILRGITMAAGTIAFVAGARTVDFADAIAILYAYPFVLIVLAVLFLGERVHWSAWTGVAGGFLGVLLVMRPEFNNFNTGTLFVFLAAIVIGLQLMLNRRLGTLSHPLVTTIWGAAIASTALLFIVPFHWRPVDAGLAWLIGVLVISGGINQFLLVIAFARASASTLAPFTYFEIVAAVPIGYLIFGTLPNWVSWLGIALITACGLVVARALSTRGRPTAKRG